MSLKGDSARFCPECHNELATNSPKTVAKVRTAKVEECGRWISAQDRLMVERRINHERLKRLAEMSPEEMQQALQVV